VEPETAMVLAVYDLIRGAGRNRFFTGGGA
jgi:hypothetical protein